MDSSSWYNYFIFQSFCTSSVNLQRGQGFRFECPDKQVQPARIKTYMAGVQDTMTVWRLQAIHCKYQVNWGYMQLANQATNINAVSVLSLNLASFGNKNSRIKVVPVSIDSKICQKLTNKYLFIKMCHHFINASLLAVVQYAHYLQLIFFVFIS